MRGASFPVSRAAEPIADRVVVRRMRPDIQQFKLSVRATAARVCRPPASRLSRLPPGASAPGSGDQNTCSRRCRRGERRA